MLHSVARRRRDDVIVPSDARVSLDNLSTTFMSTLTAFTLGLQILLSRVLQCDVADVSDNDDVAVAGDDVGVVGDDVVVEVVDSADSSSKPAAERVTHVDCRHNAVVGLEV